MDALKVSAAEKRVEVKRKLGELVGWSGYLNPDLPISKFVDALMDLIQIETVILVEQATSRLEEKHESDNKPG